MARGYIACKMARAFGVMKARFYVCHLIVRHVYTKGTFATTRSGLPLLQS